MDEKRHQYDDDGYEGNSAMVIALAGCAISGAIVGALLMWLIMI